MRESVMANVGRELELVQVGIWTHIRHKATGLIFRYRYTKAAMAQTALVRMGCPTDRELKSSYVSDYSRCKSVDGNGKVA